MFKGNIDIKDALINHNVGVHFFVPNDVEAYKRGEPCHGFGRIKYPDRSVYIGEIYFDGTRYNKLGFGEQLLFESTMGGIDPRIGLRKYKFIGQFDYRKTDWIYGNGVLYYVTDDCKPAKFVKGIFSALHKKKEYEGEYDYSLLEDGFSKDMEFDYDSRQALYEEEAAKGDVMDKCRLLLIGDSYFEFWNYPLYAGDGVFEKVFDPSTDLNVGLGGTIFADWLQYEEGLKKLPRPEKIFVNLGFNDLHCNMTPKEVEADMRSFFKMLRRVFGEEVQIYLFEVTEGGALFPQFFENEKIWNRDNILVAEKEFNVHIIRQNAPLKETGKRYFFEDDCHLNPVGYRVLEKEIKKLL